MLCSVATYCKTTGQRVQRGGTEIIGSKAKGLSEYIFKGLYKHHHKLSIHIKANKSKFEFQISVI